MQIKFEKKHMTPMICIAMIIGVTLVSLTNMTWLLFIIPVASILSGIKITIS